MSYTHEESALAEMVKNQFNRAFGGMVEVFLSEEIRLGKNWLDAIKKALTESDLVLVLFSPKSHSRPWVNIEAGYGIMAGKQVVPICCMGLNSSALSEVYGIQQSMELTNRDHALRLLDDIAAQTEAKRLLLDREDLANKWVSAATAAESLLPAYVPKIDDPILVWLIGSVTDATDEFRERAFKTADALTASLTSRNFRVVLGRTELLNYVGDCIAYKSIAPSQAETGELPQLLAMKAARRPAPALNPVIILGSLRTAPGIRRMFVDCIGRVPDVAVMIGGTTNGRAAQEGKLAIQAGIPLLPLQFTGGAAADANTTFHDSLIPEVSELQTSKRGSDIVGDQICNLIVRQVEFMRESTPSSA